MMRTIKRRFYTPYEVAMHSSPTDCWVSFLGNVFDVTDLVKENEGRLAKPLLRAAGTDISHWFDPATGDVLKHIDPCTNLPSPYCPQGQFVHVGPTHPTSEWNMFFGREWWRDGKYKVGKLSSKTRYLRVKNVLTGQEDQIEVPCEETIQEIQDRYLDLNWHAQSYIVKALTKSPTGKFCFNSLDMKKTMEQNGIMDEASNFEDCGLPADHFLPVLHMYWADDLTVA